MNKPEELLDKIIQLEADIIQRIEKLDNCYNKEEKLYDIINYYFDGEKIEHFYDIKNALEVIPKLDSLKHEIESAIKDLNKKVEKVEEFYNYENLDLISLIYDCLKFIRSITLSIRLKDSLNNYEYEITKFNSCLFEAFETIKNKLKNDFNKMSHLDLNDLEKNLSLIEFDRLRDNNYEILFRFNISLLSLEKQAIYNYDKKVDLIEILNEIEEDINDKIEIATEYVSERSDELIKIEENLNILLNDFDAELNIDTIELLENNKELLIELGTGNINNYLKTLNFEGAINEYKMTYKYWIYDNGKPGALSSFMEILE